MSWCNKPRCFVVTCISTALVLIILSAVSYPLLNKYVHDEITKATMIKPGSQVWNVWKDGGGVPILFEIYMFNLTNEDAVINKGSKPNVTTRGPYTYRVHREKFNITFNKNGTVSYRENSTYFFDRERSVGYDNETITTLSIPVITLLSYLPFKIPLLDEFLKRIAHEDIFITKTVREIVFGYNDSLLVDAQKLLPRFVNSTQVGVLYGKNFTDDGLYTVFTGETDIKKVGLIDKWNGGSSLDIWSTKYANMVNGTDGTIAPPFVIDKSFVSQMYASDICRSVYATFEEEVDHYGVNLYRYGAPKKEFLNATLNPDNEGFCIPHCFDSGVIDSSSCVKIEGLKIPIMVSNPHFVYAAKQYTDAIIGINPNQSGLNTALEIEPTTGLILKASKRLQINLNVNNTNITRNVLKKIPTMIYPLLWINETATSGKQDTDKLKSQLNMTSYAHIAQIVLFAVAGLLILAAIIVCAVFKQARPRGEDAEPFLNDTEPVEPINDNE